MKLRDRPNLKRDIAIVLVFKVIAIYLLWLLFFSHPLEKQLNPNMISQHLLGNSTPNATIRNQA